MKLTLILLLSTAIITIAQNNITNKLGDGGEFLVNDAADSPLLTIDENNGDTFIKGNTNIEGSISADNFSGSLNTPAMGTILVYPVFGEEYTIDISWQSVNIGPLLIQWITTTQIIDDISGIFVTFHNLYNSSDYTILLNDEGSDSEFNPKIKNFAKDVGGFSYEFEPDLSIPKFSIMLIGVADTN